MAYPEFFDHVPTITLFDPLAQILGASDDGMITIGYPEVVRAAGHSCPTVASAYVMTLKALEALYPDGTPVRGNIEVEFKQRLDEGVAGVIGAVVAQITGAAGPGGFKGLAGNFNRSNLMHFERNLDHAAKLTRKDTGRSVEIGVNPDAVPPRPEVMPLLQKIIAQKAGPEDKAEFTRLWQDRVRRILIDQRNDPELVSVEVVEAG
jgi:formylmethanofuran dehydrogenase subunit E